MGREHNTTFGLDFVFRPTQAQQPHDRITSHAFVPVSKSRNSGALLISLLHRIFLASTPHRPLIPTSTRRRGLQKNHRPPPAVIRSLSARQKSNRLAFLPPPTTDREDTPPPSVTMSVAYEPRSFHEDSPYAPVGENDHDMNKFINEANVADMANLAAATYEPATESSPAVFNASPSPALDLHPVGPPNVDPANVPVRDLSPAAPNAFNSTQTPSNRIKPIAKPNREVTKSEDGKFICTWPDCNELVKKFQRKCEWR